MRDLQIPINDYEELRLSAEKTRELDAYIKVFTRPLLAQVYGDDGAIREFVDIIQLFRQPDVKKARDQLMVLADKLSVDIWHIPGFFAGLRRHISVRLLLPSMPGSSEAR